VNILGISGFYHDSAAALVIDGDIVAAAQEERFSRKKHDAAFPRRAIHYCLEEAGLAHADLDYVTFYEKPFLKFDRLLETYCGYAPRGFRSFRQAMPVWIREKLFLEREIRRGMDRAYTGPLAYLEHHESHAASAFYPSPFDEAAIITVDGVGEWATTTVGVGNGRQIELLKQISFPHSLGLLYSAFTYYCGFRVNSGEYKLMGLAPYGEPRFAETIKEHLIDLREDGSFRLDMRYFNYCQGLTMTGPRFHEHFGQAPRQPETEISQFYKDIAASIQQVTEEAMLNLARFAHSLTGKTQLCLAGGVALNCVANGRILREGPFEQLWVQPAAGDAGGALGAALFTWHQLLENERSPAATDSQKGSLLGPANRREDVLAFLEQQEAIYRACTPADVARLLAAGKVVGVCQGRMEFGPRALGNRSILGDARLPDMQRNMNLAIKFRESFRPFAPAVLAEQASDYFALEDSPYMLLVADVKTPNIPAVTHIDNSARVQTVDELRSPQLRKILSAFEAETGCPLLINTSFNVRGEPMVCTPQDAYTCFMRTHMDALVLGDILLLKDEQEMSVEHISNTPCGHFPLD
jgi:carbamoyltransferase